MRGANTILKGGSDPSALWYGVEEGGGGGGGGGGRHSSYSPELKLSHCSKLCSSLLK